ncbi:hypothetical protein [Pontibacter liquoris]|uniref:hypothetical protein n=1 Tax=Pontibacter liquoris TaxID=2905677 RepID=UPI001FA79900|nr:hypothetical protein [Pontibacter liquoris]
MRKIILLTAACFGVLASYAQGLHETDEKLDKQVLALNLDGPAMATVEMQKELLLDQRQAEQVARMNQTRYAQLQQAELTFAKDPIQRAKLMRSINLENDKALKQVLTQQQLHQFLELEGRQNVSYVSENDK